jgi:hypothetical protein
MPVCRRLCPLDVTLECDLTLPSVCPVTVTVICGMGVMTEHNTVRGRSCSRS